MNVLYVYPDDNNSKFWRADIPAFAINGMEGGEHAARAVSTDEFRCNQADEDAAWADVIVVLRCLVDDVADACRKWRGAGKAVVADFDDALPILPMTNSGYEYWFGQSPDGRRIDRLYCALRDAASAVTVSTPQLKPMFEEFHGNVRVIPNCPDARRYSQAPGRKLRRPPGDTDVVIGWAGSGHIESLVGSGIVRALNMILRDRRHVRITISGGFYQLGGMSFPAYLGLPPARCLWRPWTAFPVSNWPHYMRDFDLGIAVLADHFDSFRSGIKVMDYTLMALAGHNLPWLASDQLPYKEFAEWGTLVQNTPDQWARGIFAALEHLDERRALMPQAADEMVERYDISQHVGDIVETYQGIAGL